MKLPRWLVVSLLTLSVLAVLGAGAWWWVTWPERTAREFHELVRTGRLSEAWRMMDTSNDEFMYEMMGSLTMWPDVEIEYEPRELGDVIIGRLQSRLVLTRDIITNEKVRWVEDYTVERGKLYRGDFEITSTPNR